MAKILFVGPKYHESEVLDQRHKVKYVGSWLDMGAELYKEPLEIGILEEPDPPEYDLVICDIGLFYRQLASEPEVRSRYFIKEVLPYLKNVELPVIILAEKEMADDIRDAVKGSGITQIDKPFTAEELLKTLDSL
jgi:CheY-like chemotaxis protein